MKLLASIIVLLLATTAMAGQNIVVVFDDSGSMQESLGNSTKIQAAKDSMKAVISRCAKDTKVGIIAINNGWVCPVGPITNQTIQSVDKLYANGGTPLGATMKVAGDSLMEMRHKDKFAVYRMLVITDGEAEDPDLMSRYADDIIRRGVVLDVVGVKMKGDHPLSKKAKSYRRADDPESLRRAIVEGMAEPSGKGNEEDFGMIQPLPMDTAKKALTALTEFNNMPIGEVAVEPVVNNVVVASSAGVNIVMLVVIGGAFILILMVVAIVRAVLHS